MKYLNLYDPGADRLGSRRTCKGDWIYGAVVTFSLRPGAQKVEIVRVE